MGIVDLPKTDSGQTPILGQSSRIEAVIRSLSPSTTTNSPIRSGSGGSWIHRRGGGVVDPEFQILSRLPIPARFSRGVRTTGSCFLYRGETSPVRSSNVAMRMTSPLSFAECHDPIPSSVTSSAATCHFLEMNCRHTTPFDPINRSWAMRSRSSSMNFGRSLRRSFRLLFGSYLSNSTPLASASSSAARVAACSPSMPWMMR